ncbi:DUF3422 family protein [Bradyrhizobium canariense]|uniref:DUF3422 family protein n=1 Tax=Bradyrhizobium canariense TaxID=255045 RepID=UPI0032E40243
MNDVVLLVDNERRSLSTHELRSAVLGELHARPFTPISVSSRILHFAFDTSEGRAQTDRVNLAELCSKHGVTLPSLEERYHRVQLGTTALRWEQHSEFTTYTWEIPSDVDVEPFSPRAESLAAVMGLVPQPGPLLASAASARSIRPTAAPPAASVSPAVGLVQASTVKAISAPMSSVLSYSSSTISPMSSMIR